MIQVVAADTKRVACRNRNRREQLHASGRQQRGAEGGATLLHATQDLPLGIAATCNRQHRGEVEVLTGYRSRGRQVEYLLAKPQARSGLSLKFKADQFHESSRLQRSEGTA